MVADVLIQPASRYSRFSASAVAVFLLFFLIAFFCGPEHEAFCGEQAAGAAKAAGTPQSLGDVFSGLFSGGILKNMEKSITLGGTYDDNIYLRSTNVKRDYYGLCRPKLTYDLPTIATSGKSKILTDASVGLVGDFRYYEHNTTVMNRYTLLPSATVASRVGERMTLYGNIFKSEYVSPDTLNGNPTIQSWSDFYGGEYRLGPDENLWQIAYGHSDLTYVNDINIGGNRSSNGISLTSFLGKPRANQLFLRYSLAKTDNYKNNDDNERHLLTNTMMAGVIERSPAPLLYKLAAGYSMLNPKGHKVGDLASKAVWNAELNYRPSERLGAFFRVSRTVGYRDMFPEATATKTSEQSDDEVQYESYSYLYKVPQYVMQVEKLTDSGLFGIQYVPAGYRESLALNFMASLDRHQYVSGDVNLSYHFTIAPKYMFNKFLYLIPKYDYYRTMSGQGIVGYSNNVVSLQLTMEF